MDLNFLILKHCLVNRFTVYTFGMMLHSPNAIAVTPK